MEKIEFVTAVANKDGNIAELCRRFGISRQTGYQVLARHSKEGVEGLGREATRSGTSPMRWVKRCERRCSP